VPVIKSASKKLRKDKKREAANEKVRKALKAVFKKALKSPTLPNINAAFKIIDKASKNRIVHKNKAARFKSKLSKLVKSATPKSTTSKKTKTTKKSTKKS
jgi:small subunit ribosomal protein S20